MQRAITRVGRHVRGSGRDHALAFILRLRDQAATVSPRAPGQLQNRNVPHTTRNAVRPPPPAPILAATYSRSLPRCFEWPRCDRGGCRLTGVALTASIISLVYEANISESPGLPLDRRCCCAPPQPSRPQEANLSSQRRRDSKAGWFARRPACPSRNPQIRPDKDGGSYCPLGKLQRSSMPLVAWSLALPSGRIISPCRTMGLFQWPAPHGSVAMCLPEAASYTFSPPSRA
jgi:hypothetical protein